MALAKFLATMRGRVLRAAVGVGLFLLAWFFLWDHGGIILALAGLGLVFAALNDVCFIAWLYGLPADGGWLREHEDEINQQRRAHNHS